MARTIVHLSTMQDTIRRAITRYPEQAERIKRAAVLIALDQVQRVTDDAYAVISQSRPDRIYSIRAGTYAEPATGCSCEDKANRTPASCVHEWAVDIVQVAQERQRRLDERERTALARRFAPLTETELASLSAWKRRYEAASAAERA